MLAAASANDSDESRNSTKNRRELVTEMSEAFDRLLLVGETLNVVLKSMVK
jgi:hypothetical protein